MLLRSVAKFLVPDGGGGDIVDAGKGFSYRPPRQQKKAGGPVYDNPMPEPTASPNQGRRIWLLAEWSERLTVNAKVAPVLGSISASSETVESDGRQLKQC